MNVDQNAPMSRSRSQSGWINWGGWILSAFFFSGAIIGLTAPGSVRADYARWGYPEGFHYVTGMLELAVAVLLARQRTRMIGVVLGLTVMGAATATLLIHQEFAHAVAPIAVFALLIVLGLALRLR